MQSRIRFVLLTIFGGIIIFTTGCGKSAVSVGNGDGPGWWKTLSLTQRENIAELYRVGIAIGAWQELQHELTSQTTSAASQDSVEVAWRKMIDYRRIASDRAHLAMRLADSDQLKWLRPFLSQYLESPLPPIMKVDSLRNWVTLTSTLPKPYHSTLAYIELFPDSLVRLIVTNADTSIVFWRNSKNPVHHGSGMTPDRPQAEPREERSPMNKLLRSSWLLPTDAGAKQYERWKQMVDSEFDNPNWQLGGIPRVPNEK